jgi:hypothetical protein
MAKRKKPKMTPEERAEADARSEATTRFLQARIQYHLEKLRVERGLDRTPTAEEVMRDVEAKVARAVGDA